MSSYTIEYQLRGKLAQAGDWKRLRYDGHKLHYDWDKVRSYHLTRLGDFLTLLLTILLHPDMRLVRVKLW